MAIAKDNPSAIVERKRKFPEISKKVHVIPVHKKEDKNLLKNYH